MQIWSVSRCGADLVVAALLSLATLFAPTSRASAQDPWALTNDQRRAYLAYYSPIIFKRADEGDDHDGYDWITNYDFDQDADFSNNKDHWEDVEDFVAGSQHSEWRIRPTLYTALIEYTLDGVKSITMLYHVNHAKQQGSIHDWERIEIRVNDVNGVPGSGSEDIGYVVITEHSEHNGRQGGHGDLNYMETANGRHLMLWQAEWSGTIGFRKAELRYVEDSWETVDNDNQDGDKAELELNGADGPFSDGDRPVNYVFVLESDEEAVSYWGAQAVTQANAEALSSGTSNSRDWDEIPRVTYQLQDIADLWPTHWTKNPDQPTHWDADEKVKVFLETAVRNEVGSIVVEPGMQKFAHLSIDDEDGDESRNGYPNKNWMWGAYLWDYESSFKSEAFEDGAPNGERGHGTEHQGVSYDKYWWQHDYFAHDGVKGDGDPNAEAEGGQWLYGDWYTPAAGGFDGRWVQLFADDHAFEPALTPPRNCGLMGAEALLFVGLIGLLRRRAFLAGSR